ncbi:hypothetical protein BBG7_1304 [Bifidobacterium longum]|nr:hypothetical protein BBG7_1304 [Bifidobacterium longum]
MNRILISGAWCFTRHGITPVVRCGGPVAPAIAGPSLARLLYRGGDWRYAAYNKQFVQTR